MREQGGLCHAIQLQAGRGRQSSHDSDQHLSLHLTADTFISVTLLPPPTLAPLADPPLRISVISVLFALQTGVVQWEQQTVMGAGACLGPPGNTDDLIARQEGNSHGRLRCDTLLTDFPHINIEQTGRVCTQSPVISIFHTPRLKVHTW